MTYNPMQSLAALLLNQRNSQNQGAPMGYDMRDPRMGMGALMQSPVPPGYWNMVAGPARRNVLGQKLQGASEKTNQGVLRNDMLEMGRNPDGSVIGEQSSTGTASTGQTPGQFGAAQTPWSNIKLLGIQNARTPEQEPAMIEEAFRDAGRTGQAILWSKKPDQRELRYQRLYSEGQAEARQKAGKR